MMEDTHIADGTAVKLLLAGLVLASGAVGALGLTHGTSQAAVTGAADGSSAQLAFPIDNVSASTGSLLLSMDGKGNDPYPRAAFPIDNVTAAFPIDNVTAAFPIDNVTAAFPIDNVTAAFPIDNVTAAFPIDNVSASGGSWDVAGTNRVGGIETGSSGANAFSLARVEAPDELPQDMDPY
jgi:hypothetical protein